MRLTWRDAVSTAMVVIGLTLAVSVVAGWQWPLLGGVREGIVALAVFGLASCVFGSPLDRFSFTDPFGLGAMLVAMIALAVGVVGGLITGSVEYLYIVMVVTLMLWALATLRHMIEGEGEGRLIRLA